MKQPIFTGVATALVTPFRDGAVDLATFDRLLDAQLAAGIDALVICGTTGESATLTTQEQLSLISHAVDYAAGRCKIIAGTGSNSTAHALEMSRMAASVGADALLLVTPYYNKCTQSGLIEHYTTIADQVKTPVIVYNVPSRTGMDITLETYKTLSEHPNINGVKEAGPSIAKAARTLDACGDALNVWSGNDDSAVPLLSIGGKGLISVLSNVRPAQTLDMVKSALRGDYARAGRLQLELMPLIDALFCEVNPIPVKAAMPLVGFPCGSCRMPLSLIEPDHLALLQQQFTMTKQLGLC